MGRGSVRSRMRLLALLPPLLAWGSAAFGAVSPEVRTPEVAVRLLSAVDAVGDLDRIPLGVGFRLAPGWKTYWRAPGGSGFPPHFDWEKSRNLAAAEVAWPAPERFSLFGIDSIGYADEVVLPVDTVPAQPGEPLDLRLALDFLVCSDVCVPQRAQLAMHLPAGPAAPSAEAFGIDRWRGRVPGPPGPALGILRATLVDAGERPELRLALNGGRVADVFVESDGDESFGRPEPVPGGVALPVTFSPDGPGALVGREIVATVTGTEGAVEQRVTVARGGGAGEEGTRGLAVFLLAALLGGMILNLMPCVLPVLALKLMGFAVHGGAERGAARASFLASAAGIVFSFLLLAGAAVGMRTAGMAVGWGIQFQQPLFLALMMVLLMVFAANLWGLFEVPMPRLAGRMASGRGTRRGAFATGMLATLLATPCSAPFVGTAVGFALSRGPGEIVAVFTALGLGMAVPYLAVAAFPRLASVVPRPGRWMVWLRGFLGIALTATAVWLASVLLVQTGVAVALAAAAAAAVPPVWLALARRHALASGAAAALVAALAVSLPPDRVAAVPDARWQVFDERRIPELVSRGDVVLVDVTADWCLTCKVNKAAVLDRDPVAGRLAEGIVAMRADWTRPDAAISAYLAGFGRYGIPFYAVYGPGAPTGLVLPELLTPGAVLDALEKAAVPARRRVDRTSVRNHNPPSQAGVAQW